MAERHHMCVDMTVFLLTSLFSLLDSHAQEEIIIGEFHDIMFHFQQCVRICRHHMFFPIIMIVIFWIYDIIIIKDSIQFFRPAARIWLALWLGFFLHVHPLLLGVDARAGRGVVGGHQLLRGYEAQQSARGAGEASRGLQGQVEIDGMESMELEK